MLVLRQPDILELLHSLSAPQVLHLQQSLLKTLTQHSALPSETRHALQPARSHLTSSAGTTLLMPASTPTSTVVKTVTLPSSGGPAIGTLTISSPLGITIGLLNAEEVTAFRTALVALILFIRHPWKADGNVVIFGAGKIVEWHLRLLLLLAPEKVASLALINRSLAGLERLAEVIYTLRKQHPEVDFQLVAKDQEDEYDEIIEEALAESDAIFCCTPSTEPLFPHKYLGKGRPRYISLIGSYKPHMQEITKETLLSADRICVDSRDACLDEAGELIMAGIKGDRITELGEIGEENGCLSIENKAVVFKCVGMGIMDAVVGRELLNIAHLRGLGIEISEF
ncbi:ornithine cyclodeaminase/mu-crystallin family protein [Calycina marina]|uniref:Ornithine cyclodeaminase/mu-crystallin family protein n=1 Tax=Calycina marina TaxID=1763456 RepID=A0A9P7Z4D8_9HELO|nr:ornithine cyclodeaminase/mu-crystallin family protein [Calycina marina]